MSPGRRTPSSLLGGSILGSLLKLSIPIVLAFVLSRDGVLGLEGLWRAYPVTNVLIAVVTVIWFMKGDW
ncbi:hypothetical protein [Modicisalibacter xianhensis]|uniref:Uncharacterized protein n=1 Tax=Modicisalibacter xianhensis TaxID=442341 RepID=A0A1I3C7Y3_9GAMM|nr:hypothetical protein [Halomonas xianhensis]SFH70670.1 hypothetical protein SAMN04487959_10860 [Halomonas xianhensis]